MTTAEFHAKFTCALAVGQAEADLEARLVGWSETGDIESGGELREAIHRTHARDPKRSRALLHET